MAVFVATNTFVSNAAITAAGHNTNWSDVTTWLNNRYNGSDTWSFMKVSSTNANPVDIVSTAASTELSLNNTATDGDPILTFKLSGTQTHVIGVDDSDSDALIGATTSITTNSWMRVPAVGAQVQFNAGTVSLPGISFIGDIDTGLYSFAGDQIGFSGAAGNIGVIGVFSGTAQFQGRDGSVTAPYWSFVNNPTMGIYRVSANTLGFVTGGSEAMRIDSSQRVGIGGTPAGSGRMLYVTKSSGNAIARVNAITGQIPAFELTENDDITAGKYWQIYKNVDPGNTLAIWNSSERLIFDSNGNVVVNSAGLATTATDGFLYIPSCAGAPTGVPTTYTNRLAMIYDRTNNKFYIYNGAWKGVTLA